MHPSLLGVRGALNDQRPPYVEVRSEMAFVELPGATIGKVQDILLDKPKRCWVADLFQIVEFFGGCFGGGGEQRCGDDPLS